MLAFQKRAKFSTNAIKCKMASKVRIQDKFIFNMYESVQIMARMIIFTQIK